MYVGQMGSTGIPIGGLVGELFSTVATGVEGYKLASSRRLLLRGSIVGWWYRGGRIEGAVVLAVESGTGPRMFS